MENTWISGAFTCSRVFTKYPCRLHVNITTCAHWVDFGSALWNTGYVGDLRLLESVQRRWTKQIRSMSNLSYAERLSSLNLYSIKGRLFRADLIMTWKIMHGNCPQLAHLFTRVDYDRTIRGHSKKLFKPRHETDIRARSFATRVIEPWNSLPEGVVSAPSLFTYKRLLSDFLGDFLFEFL